jgi:pimeloyl-ACP methyl ester carboxylesterase
MTTVADRRVSVRQNRIRPNIKVAGNGPPLVFLHGAGGAVWDAFLAALAANHTVYAPEHPGFTDGEEDAIARLDNLWDLVLYYHEMFDALSLKSVPVIGHCYGAMVAAELAANSPERVSKLVLMCPIGLWREDAPIPNWMLVTPASDLPKHLMHDSDGPLARQMFSVPDTELQLRMIWSTGGTAKLGWPVPEKGLKQRIHDIQAPTMVLWGKQDKLVPVRYAEEFGRRIPGAKVTVIDQAGHLFPAEYPERVARMVEDFLR